MVEGYCGSGLRVNLKQVIGSTEWLWGKIFKYYTCSIYGEIIHAKQENDVDFKPLKLKIN